MLAILIIPNLSTFYGLFLNLDSGKLEWSGVLLLFLLSDVDLFEVTQRLIVDCLFTIQSFALVSGVLPIVFTLFRNGLLVVNLLNHDFDFISKSILSPCCRSHGLLNRLLLLHIDLSK